MQVVFPHSYLIIVMQMINHEEQLVINEASVVSNEGLVFENCQFFVTVFADSVQNQFIRSL